MGYMIDYALVLQVITASEDPADALAAFVRQEREHAEHRGKAETWDEGWQAGQLWAFSDLDEYGKHTNPYRD